MLSLNGAQPWKPARFLILQIQYEKDVNRGIKAFFGQAKKNGEDFRDLGHMICQSSMVSQAWKYCQWLENNDTRFFSPYPLWPLQKGGIASLITARTPPRIPEDSALSASLKNFQPDLDILRLTRRIPYVRIGALIHSNIFRQ